MFNHSVFPQSNTCLAYKIFPLISAFRIIGLEVQAPCQCTKIKTPSSAIFTIYTHFVELYLWLGVFVNPFIFAKRISCGKVISLFGNFANQANFILLGVAIYIAVQYSITKRKKISFHYRMNIYQEEEHFFEKIEIYLMAIFSNLFFLLIMISISTTLVFYSYLRIEECGDLEALFCSISFQIYFIFITCQAVFILGFCFITFLIMGKRLIELAKQIEVRRIANIAFLQYIMEKHLEIWEFFQHVNEQWKILLPLNYIFFGYFSCFMLYGAIFVDLNPLYHSVIIVFAILVIFGNLAVSRALSVLSSLIYDNFIAIAKFSSIPLTAIYKFKIIGFMKRFGGRSMGISMAGFFFVKRQFFIRVVSGMYSVFSTLLQLTGVIGQKKCSPKINRNFFTLNQTKF